MYVLYIYIYIHTDRFKTNYLINKNKLVRQMFSDWIQSVASQIIHVTGGLLLLPYLLPGIPSGLQTKVSD